MSVKPKKQKQPKDSIIDNYTKIVVKAQKNLAQKIENINNPNQYVKAIIQLSSFIVAKPSKEEENSKQSDNKNIVFLLSKNDKILIKN